MFSRFSSVFRRFQSTLTTNPKALRATTLLSLLMAGILVIGTVSFTSTAQKPTLPGAGQPITTITALEGEITRKQVESPDGSDKVRMVNVGKSSADIDFVAINQQGDEVARETVEVAPNGKTQAKLEDLFPAVNFGDLSTIEVQSSVRPADSAQFTGTAGTALATTQAILPVAFFSQRDPRWANNRLGTCSTTIGQQGCVITSIAMAGARSVYNFNPATLNTYLTNNSGYASGCLVVWSAPAKIDGSGGFTYIGTGTVGSAANLKSVTNLNRFAVARSYRFSPHYVTIIGYYNQGTYLSDFVYLDPWDLSATFRRVNDGWVTATSATQIYQ
jgi:hypothetical protein